MSIGMPIGNGPPVNETKGSGLPKAKPRPCPGNAPPGPVCRPLYARAEGGWMAACAICGRTARTQAPEEQETPA